MLFVGNKAFQKKKKERKNNKKKGITDIFRKETPLRTVSVIKVQDIGYIWFSGSTKLVNLIYLSEDMCLYFCHMTGQIMKVPVGNFWREVSKINHQTCIETLHFYIKVVQSRLFQYTTMEIAQILFLKSNHMLNTWNINVPRGPQVVKCSGTNKTKKHMWTI